MQKAASEAGRRELVRLRHRMRLLGALPQVATMLGLLGTVLGMIKTFQAVAASGQSLGKTELLARGIFEAWANTAAGLLVAIPVLIAYHALLGRIDARIVELDRAATDWIESEQQAQPSHKPVVVVRPSAEREDQAIPVAAGA
jgi:biopolymer transport protein ExbB